MSKRSRSMWDMQEIIGSVDTARVLMLLAQQSQNGVVGGGFVSGAQSVVALGGHMRRHRAEAEAATMNDVSKPAPVKACDGGGVCLDLNLTPSENCAKCRNVVGLAAGGQGVHKALAMLDCFL
uniref:Uncharacterized protein n=1 Tax=Oryza brachyantha TaxID=4533 RepID=J3L5M7_ORYBR